MNSTSLKVLHPPQLPGSTLLLALTGWMDGGDVSTGTVKQLINRRQVKRIATIAPDEFYIFNFPGSMEISALFRPHVKYEGGVVAEIPSYLQGTNPLSIEAIARRLASILNQPIDLDALRETSNEWESQVSAAVENDAELAETIRKLEEAYDNELIEAE